MGYAYQVIGPDDEPRLRDEHAYLNRLLSELLYLAGSGDFRSYEHNWLLFTSELEQHMRYEELLLFPTFEKTSPEADACIETLRAEHHLFREQIRKLSRELNEQACCVGEIDAFASGLREHQQREGRVLYPWLASLPPQDVMWRTLYRIRQVRPIL